MLPAAGFARFVTQQPKAKQIQMGEGTNVLF